MAHRVGEHLRCNECGAEIVYVKACPCPEDEQKRHADVCCDQKMENLGVRSRGEETAPAAPAPGH